MLQDIAANPQLKSDINHNFYEKAREKVKKETRTLSCPDANTELAKSFLRHAAQVYKSHRSVAETDNRFINNAWIYELINIYFNNNDNYSQWFFIKSSGSLILCTLIVVIIYSMWKKIIINLRQTMSTRRSISDPVGQ